MHYLQLYKPYLDEDGFCNIPGLPKRKPDLITGNLGNLTVFEVIKHLGISNTQLRYIINYPEFKPQVFYFGEWCNFYANLRNIDLEVAKEAIGENIDNNIVFPYRDLHNNIVDERVRNPLSGKIVQDCTHRFLFHLNKDNTDFPISFIVKGESDVLKLVGELRNREIHHVGVYGLPTPEIKREYLREITSEQVIVFPDSGSFGQRTIDSYNRVKSSGWELVEHIWKPGQVGKDFTDWFGYKDNTVETLLPFCTVRQRVQIINDLDFMQVERPTNSWIIENLIAMEQIVFIAGPQKSRKTFLMLGLVKSILTGGNFLGIPAFKGNPAQNILIIENEGSAHDLATRRKKILGDTSYQNLYFIHNPGIKFDNPKDVAWIIEEMRRLNITFLLIDPMQDFHNADDENSAAKMQPFWDGIKLIKRQLKCAILIIHHFNQSGTASGLWDSMRGSTRNAGTADLGMFLEKEKSGKHNFAIDGREFQSTVMPGDTRSIKLTFNPGTLEFELARIPMDNDEFTLAWGDRVSWVLADCAEHFGCSPRTITRRITSPPLSDKFVLTPPSPGNPVSIQRK